MHLFHKWKNIQCNGIDFCLGESYTRKLPTEYYICVECGMLKIKYHMYHSGVTTKLHENEEKIVRKKLNNSELTIEDGYNYKDIMSKLKKG